MTHPCSLIQTRKDSDKAFQSCSNTVLTFPFQNMSYLFPFLGVSVVLCIKMTKFLALYHFGVNISVVDIERLN